MVHVAGVQEDDWTSGSLGAQYMDALIRPKPERLSALLATVGAGGTNGVDMYMATCVSVHVLNNRRMFGATLRPCERAGHGVQRTEIQRCGDGGGDDHGV